MRFVVKTHGSSFYIVDTLAKCWKMPEKAVSLYLRESAAIRVCHILNEEWNYFVAFPDT